MSLEWNEVISRRSTARCPVVRNAHRIEVDPAASDFLHIQLGCQHPFLFP
jgi:hypothetical protein